MDVLQVNENELMEVRKYFHVSTEEVVEGVKIVKNWLEQQSHLPTIDDEQFIERCLLRNKYRIERTKEKLESYFTLRGRHYELLCDFNQIVPSRENTWSCPLPKLGPNMERIIIWKLRGPAHDYNMKSVVRFCLFLFEIMMRNDYAVGDRFIADFQGHTFTSLASHNPIMIARFIKLYQESYSGRIVGVDFINAPSFITHLLNILKYTLPKKLYKRIHVHKDIKSFHKILPKEYLPKDYGGDLDSVENLFKKWDKVFEHNQSMFEQNLRDLKRTSNKIEEKTNIIGITGTFKELNLD